MFRPNPVLPINEDDYERKVNTADSGIKGYLGKVSPTFQAALFSMDARSARKIENPQKDVK